MDLENLFKWKGEIIIRDSKGEPVILRKKPLVLYQRIVGDANIQIARQKALKASADLRKELRDEDSDIQAAFLPEVEGIDNERLSNSVALNKILELREVAEQNITQPRKPAALSGSASLEEQEKYQQGWEDYQKELETRINGELTKHLEKERKQLMENPRETLVQMFKETAINNLCKSEMLRVFNSWCAYFGTYRDKAMENRAFNSFEKFENSARELKGQIIGGYLQLELSGEDIKN